MAGARELGAVDVGMYTLLSMRIEKGFGIWTREFSRDYTPAESSLAMGYVASGAAEPEARLEVTIVGERRTCRVLSEPPVDPSGSMMRM